jgi:acyl carrier protein
MTEHEVIEGAREVLIRRLKVSAAVVTADTVIQDLGADSFDLLMITGEFEDLFDVEISRKELMQIRTFGDIIRSLSVKLGYAA